MWPSFSAMRTSIRQLAGEASGKRIDSGRLGENLLEIAGVGVLTEVSRANESR
jgi:hypothetical protein